MAAIGVSFRWLDLLEKEFDKAYVDLELLIGKSNFYDSLSYIRRRLLCIVEKGITLHRTRPKHLRKFRLPPFCFCQNI